MKKRQLTIDFEANIRGSDEYILKQLIQAIKNKFGSLKVTNAVLKSPITKDR